MFRVGLVIFTTAALLICPYNCTARSLVASPKGEVSQRQCSCCKKSCTRSKPVAIGQSEAPQAPDDSEDACSCLCNGAISPTSVIVFTTCVNWIDGRDLLARSMSVGLTVCSHDLSPPDDIETGLCPSLSMQSLLL